MAWRSDFTWLWRGAVVGLVLAGAMEGTSILIGRNFHEVIPGRVYRSAQPSLQDARRAAEDFGVRTIINLRGCSLNAEWYAAEASSTAELDMCQEDVTLSAGRLPAAQELRRLVEILDRAEYPLLLHCRRGVDRTGLTSAAILLLNGSGLREALRELSLTHGHVSLGRTVAMKRFYALYQHWLQQTCRDHSAANFRDYILRGYIPGPAKSRLELIDSPEVRVGQTAAVRIRAHNDSGGDWYMRPGTGSGVHMKFQVTNSSGVQVQEGHAGLYTARVSAGSSVELTLALAKLRAPGRYVLTADLLDGPETAFAQLGNEPLFWEFEVR